MDWNLGFTIFDGQYVVDMIGQFGVKGVGEYFVHTSDSREGAKMVNTLKQFVSEPVKYVPDIDYTLALGRKQEDT